MNEEVTQIITYLKKQQSSMVAFLEKLVIAESPSTIPEAQQEVIKILTEKLESIDYNVTHIPGKLTGGHLYATPKVFAKKQPYQILIGHCDTVWPLNIINSMKVEVQNNQMKGPGVYDMKGGLTQMIFALSTIHDLHLSPLVTPVVFINSDEEIGSVESEKWIKKYAKNADRAFILEPSLGESGKLKTRRKGVGNFEIKVTGKAAHAGLDPQRGVSAIVELSYLVQKLFAMNDFERGISVNVGMIQGGVRPNVIAPESCAVIDVRVPTQEDARKIEKQILSLKPSRQDVTLEITGSIERQPMEQTERNKILWNLAQTAAQKLGLNIDEGCAGGGSDGNITSLYTATLDGLGAIGDGAHAQHEFIYTDKLWERTALLVLLLLHGKVSS